MILPNKYLAAEKSLLWIGAEILRALKRPKTVSRLWDEMRRRKDDTASQAITYNWFVLALDFLYIVGAIELDKGRLRKIKS